MGNRRSSLVTDTGNTSKEGLRASGRIVVAVMNERRVRFSFDFQLVVVTMTATNSQVSAPVARS